MGSVYRRGNKLWIAIMDRSTGKQRCMPSGFKVGEETLARQAMKQLEAQVAAQGWPQKQDLGPITVEKYAKTWIRKREARGVEDAENEEAHLRLHVLPHIGSMAMQDVRPRHLKGVVDGMRGDGKHAPRTVLRVYGTMRLLFRAAVIDEVIVASPAVLGKGELPKKEDKDSAWRSSAIYTRQESVALISSDLIPPDRRMLYGLEFLAAARIGEAVAQRWWHYDQTAEPLGRLLIARSHQKKTTKSHRGREMPVHPVLAAMLAEWKLGGWVEMMGRQPTPDDLIVPSRDGEMRSRHHARNKLLEDLDRLGLRHRRSHDLRRTFITLARVDGARGDILEHVTHAQRGDIINVYTSLPWAALCEEVAKLKIERRGGHLHARTEDDEKDPDPRHPPTFTTVPTTATAIAAERVATAWKNKGND